MNHKQIVITKIAKLIVSNISTNVQTHNIKFNQSQITQQYNTTHNMFYCKNCITITETIHEMRRHLVLRHLGYAIYGYLFSAGRTDPIRPACYYPTCIRSSQAIRWENYLQYIIHMALDHNILDEYLRDSCTNRHTIQ